MRDPRGYGSRRAAWLGWMLAFGALLPVQGWAQEVPRALLSLPLLGLEQQAAPVAFDCTPAQAGDHLMLRDPGKTPPAAACPGVLGFSENSGSFGWFGALGKFRYLVALPPALLAAGGGGGGGGGGGSGGGSSGHDDGVVPGNEPEHHEPYRSPVPEPASTALFVSGALLVAGAVRRRSR